MLQPRAIKIKLSLQDTQIPVTRTVVWHDQITAYEIHLLINGLFNFEETKDVELTYGEETMRMVGDDVDDAFVLTLDKTEFCNGTPLYYTYMGESNWNVVITLTYLEEKPKQELPYFVEGTGQAILNPDLTITEYNECVAAAQNGDVELLTMSSKKLTYLGTDITKLSEQQMQQEVEKVYAFYNEILAIEKNHEHGCSCGHHHHEDEKVEKSTQDNSFITFEEEQEMIAKTLETYTQILGLTEEQASYLVLYTGAIETIIEEMENAGYDEDTIDKMMQGKLAMDEAMYEAIAESLELLETLPPREEMLSEEDEKKLAILDSVMNETMITLEENGIDIDALMEVGGEFPEEIEEKMLKKLLNDLGQISELN